MRCPRCHVAIPIPSDPASAILCPGCGVRLLLRPKTIPPRSPVDLASHPPDQTIPPPALTSSPPATPPKASEPKANENGNVGSATLEQVMAELRSVRLLSERILAALEQRAGFAEPAETHSAPPAPGNGDEPVITPVRQRRRKTVVIIDDDPETREAARAGCAQAEIPVRVCESGREGIEAIARERPDVLVLELDVSGEMAGRDIVNMIKATMEWVDIRIVLYTRLKIESQKEARTVHGADEVVRKGEGAAVLVSRIIGLFRRA